MTTFSVHIDGVLLYILCQAVVVWLKEPKSTMNIQSTLLGWLFLLYIDESLLF